MIQALRSATAFAPASVGNVGVGFDLLGQCLESPGDLVRARRRAAPGVSIAPLPGLPAAAEENTAGRAALSLLGEARASFGVDLTVTKGIPLGSGMGGSAASAVAAVVACNALLDEPLSMASLLRHALEGELAASGSYHADNVAPSLYGGLVLAAPGAPVQQLPVPPGLRCVLLHPHLRLDTRAGRERLRRDYELAEIVIQNGHLAGFISACYRGDLAALSSHFYDTLIEPQRKDQVPGFDAAMSAARAAGALGGSLSGSGPSLFAWCRSADAANVALAMGEALAAQGLAFDCLQSAIDAPGAHIVERET